MVVTNLVLCCNILHKIDDFERRLRVKTAGGLRILN